MPCWPASFSQPLWTLPGLGTLTLKWTVSRPFLFRHRLVLFPASIFAGGELNRAVRRPARAPFTVLMFGLYASIVLIFIAGDALLFLLAWEVMSILSYLLIVSELAMKTAVRRCRLSFAGDGEAGTLGGGARLSRARDPCRFAGFFAIKSTAAELEPGARWTFSCSHFSASA